MAPLGARGGRPAADRAAGLVSGSPREVCVFARKQSGPAAGGAPAGPRRHARRYHRLVPLPRRSWPVSSSCPSSSSRGPSCVTRAPPPAPPTGGRQRREHPSADPLRVRVRQAAILRHRDRCLHLGRYIRLDRYIRHIRLVVAYVWIVTYVWRVASRPGESVPSVAEGIRPPPSRGRPRPEAGPHGPRAPGVGPADGARPVCRGRGEWSSAPRRRRGWRRAPCAPAVPFCPLLPAAPILPHNYSYEA